MIQKDHLCS